MLGPEQVNPIYLWSFGQKIVDDSHKKQKLTDLVRDLTTKTHGFLSMADGGSGAPKLMPINSLHDGHE